MKRLAVALPLAAFFTAAAVAGNPAPPAPPTEEQVIAGWEHRLATEHQQLSVARARLQRAEAALGDARQRRSPRGPELAALYAERDDAEKDLAEREAAWPELLEEARRAGVPPAVLMEYDEPASAE